MQWMMDILAAKPKLTNTSPDLIYMLKGAVQHSYTDPFDRMSPCIPSVHPGCWSGPSLPSTPACKRACAMPQS
jgi:hypothetical protein